MEKIIDRFKRIVRTKHVNVKRIEALNRFIEEFDDDYKHRKQVIEIIKIIESLEEGDVDEKIIKKIQKILKEVTDNDVTCEIVSSQLKVEKVEKELDSHVKKYCGFSEKKPMDYVSFHIGKNSYECNCKGVRKYLKNKEKLCEFTLNILRRNFRTEISEIPPKNKTCLEYENTHLIIFALQNILLFDIRQVLSVLDINDRMIERKYKEFSPKITHFMCVKNEFGGFIIRELIPEEVMYEIILSSNSKFSKSFKKDVSMILKKAREDNKLFVVDDKIVYDAQPSTDLVLKKKFLCIEGCENDMTKKVLGTSITTISCIYLFTIGFVKDLRKSMKIDDKYNDNDIVVKYGRTDNLLERSQQHNKTFKKYNGNAKLKYYVWIDSEFQSKAEINVKNYFKRMHKLFSCETSEELAILTREELKEVKDYFGQISNIYCGKLKNMIDTYKKSLIDKEKKIIGLKKDCEMKDQLLIKERESLMRERETTKLLMKLLDK
jgi:Asp-tRNA(Asn)/Glu-tRNA(Gln) amidotransferase C subunit